MQDEVKIEPTVETPVAPETKEEEKPLEYQAAFFLHGALPAFRSLMGAVSGVQGKRVLEALIETPLEKEVPNFTTKEASRLYDLGLEITNAKFILFQAQYLNQLASKLGKPVEELRALIAEAMEDEVKARQTQSEENKESVNDQEV